MGEKEEKKVKQPSIREMEKEEINRIAGEMEQLTPGQTLIYKLPEFYWSGLGAFLIAELNTLYPQKGRKYIMSRDDIADGKPAGKKARMFESNKPTDFGELVSRRQGERFV